jgi:hypothetical protein
VESVRNDLDRDSLAAQVFAIDLDRCGGQDLYVVCTQDTDAADALHTPEGDVQHVPSVSQRIRSFEQNDFEIVVMEGGSGGDLQIAAIIPDPAN